MFRLIRVYDDGRVIEGHYLFTEFDIEQLACLVSQIKTITYEFAIATCIEEEVCVSVKKKVVIVQM